MQDILPSIDAVAGLTPKALAEHDIAFLNLCIASGLTETESLNVPELLSRLDDWAAQVKFEICRHLYRLDHLSPQLTTEFSYGNSVGRFFCWFMLQVLQEDCGVAYHPERKSHPDFCRPEDLFIHGIVEEGGTGGTCASMPVIYVAVGRRLGLPVYLVETRGHLFFRWDDPTGTTIEWQRPDLTLWIPPDRFNVEGAGEGIAYYSDSHYVRWPELWTEEDLRHGQYLKCLNAERATASFLVQRAECCYELGDWEECLKAIYYARQLAPDDPRYEWLHAKRTKQVQAHEQSMELLHELETRPLNGAPRHSWNCGCLQCQQTMKVPGCGPSPPHGVSCQCWHCRTEREAVAAPPGMPNHHATCQCAGCGHQRTLSAGGAARPAAIANPNTWNTPLHPQLPQHALPIAPLFDDIP